MCGIVGFLEKRNGSDRPIGSTLLNMLEALSCRGPDSTGIAVLGPERSFWTVQVALPRSACPTPALSSIRDQAEVLRHEIVGDYLRLEVARTADPGDLEKILQT